MTTYNGSSLKKVGFRVQFPDGSKKRVNSRANAEKLVAMRGLSQADCQLLRIGVSRNGMKAESPVAW